MNPRLLRLCTAVTIAVFAITLMPTLSASAASSPDEHSTPAAERRPSGDLPLKKGLVAKAERDGEVRVLVRLVDNSGKSEVPDDLEDADAPAEVLHTYRSPVLLLNANAKALTALSKNPRVLSIAEDGLNRPDLKSSTTVIGAPAVHSAGFTGSGRTVAIIDTGIDRDHPFFAGRIVSEACYSTASTATGTTERSLCPNGTATETGAGAADAETANCLDGTNNLCDHGVHVAGIAAGEDDGIAGLPAGVDDGVAPDANIVAIQVFHRENSTTTCGATPAPCVLSNDSDILRALERVETLVTQASPIAISSVNVSIGGGVVAAACDTHATKPVVDRLLNRNVLTIKSAGNSGGWGVSGIGCISTVVTVGNSQDDDSLAGDSNRGPLVDVFAPGSAITSSVPDDAWGGMSGTSMAAPMVTGAVAVLRAAYPNMSANDMVARLRNTGTNLTYNHPMDPKISQTTPRISLLAALEEFRNTKLTYTGQTTFTNGSAGMLTATLTRVRDNVPLHGETVNFNLGDAPGTQICQGVASPATCTLTPVHQKAGSHPLSATYAGTTFYRPSSDVLTATVNKGATTIQYTGDTTLTNGTSSTLSGVLRSDAGPIRDATLTFTAGTGNDAQSCTGVTDANGKASCTIARVLQPAGPKTVTSSFSGDDYWLGSTLQTSGEVKLGPVTLTYTGPDVVVNGSSATLSATMKDAGGTPLSGRQVELKLGDGPEAQSCTGTTGPDGAASCTISRVLQPAGPTQLTLGSETDAFWQSTTTTVLVEAQKGETVATYTGPPVLAQGERADLSGILAQRDGGIPLEGKTLTFTIGSGADAQSCDGTTDATGVATCSIDSVSQPALGTSTSVEVSFAGDQYWLPSSVATEVEFVTYEGRAFARSWTGPLGRSWFFFDTGEVRASGPHVVEEQGNDSTDSWSRMRGRVEVERRKITATANVAEKGLSLLGVGTLQLRAVKATSVSTCDTDSFNAASTADSIIGSITVAGKPIAISGKPNQVVNLGLAKLVINEQTTVSGVSAGSAVTAVHVLAAGIDAKYAYARSAVRNCG